MGSRNGSRLIGGDDSPPPKGTDRDEQKSISSSTRKTVPRRLGHPHRRFMSISSDRLLPRAAAEGPGEGGGPQLPQHGLPMGGGPGAASRPIFLPSKSGGKLRTTASITTSSIKLAAADDEWPRQDDEDSCYLASWPKLWPPPHDDDDDDDDWISSDQVERGGGGPPRWSHPRRASAVRFYCICIN